MENARKVKKAAAATVRAATVSVLVVWLLFGMSVATSVQASTVDPQEQRTALIIGNADYKEAPLRNPVNDANAMAGVLTDLGFKVIKLTNAKQREMSRAIVQFGEALTGGGVGLFYYSGHAIQVRGRNFMMPVDAVISAEGSVAAETVNMELLMEQMMLAENRLNIIIMDACRNNPFETRFRSVRRGGLAAVDAPMGTFIAYATAPGAVASDGDGTFGLYTNELLKHMATPGLRIEDVFKRVRRTVSESTLGAQVPWESSSLTGDFFFAGRGDAGTPVPMRAVPTRGKLIVRAPSDQAEVYVNGTLQGVGSEFSFDVPPGAYQVEVRGPYAGTQVESTRVGAGEKVLVKFADVVRPDDGEGLDDFDTSAGGKEEVPAKTPNTKKKQRPRLPPS